jgi:hypothetical protein
LIADGWNMTAENAAILVTLGLIAADHGMAFRLRPPRATSTRPYEAAVQAQKDAQKAGQPAAARQPVKPVDRT